MALYDNKHWLLSHIRDSFISTDDTGLCEMVMQSEDIPKTLKANGVLQCYAGVDDSDDEDIDAMAESYEIQMDMPFSHRPRSNTAQRLEQMDLEKKQASKVKHVKWEQNAGDISEKERMEMFQRKDFRKKDAVPLKASSMLTEQLEKCPDLPQNPFMEFAKFDGSAQVGIPVRKYRIFLCMLPQEQRMYPIQVSVIACAKVSEFIGLICFKYACENSDHNLKEDITKYGLYIMEDDGEVDWDFPCLDPRETISKFEFMTLGLVELKISDIIRHNTISTVVQNEEEEDKKEKELETAQENLAKMEGHTTAMEAPLYQLYRVNIVNKVRAKTEIHLGISGEKIEIDPVVAGKGAGRFWNRQRAVSYHIDNIAWCEVTEYKGSKTSFILVYTVHSNFTLNNLNISSNHMHSLQQSTSFKTHDFEADTAIAEEIVCKINHILELRSSTSRKEYLSHRERKATRKKSFHLHR